MRAKDQGSESGKEGDPAKDVLRCRLRWGGSCQRTRPGSCSHSVRNRVPQVVLEEREANRMGSGTQETSDSRSSRDSAEVRAPQVSIDPGG